MRIILFVVILSIAASSGCAGQSLGNGGGDAPLIQCADVANRKHLNILSINPDFPLELFKGKRLV